MRELTAADAGPLADRLARAFEEQRDSLNELDARLGDGDHGLSMARGFSAVAALMKTDPPASVSDALNRSGAKFNEVSGSTIGILIFSAMREAAKAAEGRQRLAVTDLAPILEAGIRGIRTRGKAEAGQKTILDALEPALEALRVSLSGGQQADAALRAMARAAAEGAEITREMVSRIGRARWFAERSRGELDPGAVSGSLILKVVSEYLLEGGSP